MPSLSHRSPAVLVAAALLLPLFGCRTLPKIAQPNAPVTQALPAAPPSSMIRVPVSISLALLESELQKAVPSGEHRDRDDRDRILVGKLAGMDAGYRYRWERSGIRLGAASSGPGLEASADLHYSVKVGAKAPLVGWADVCCGCGREWPRVGSLRLTTTVTVAPDWSPIVGTTVSLAAHNDCYLSEFKVKATPYLLEAARKTIEGKVAEIQKAAGSQIALRSRAQQAWDLLQRPLPVASGVSLLLNPQAFYLSPPTATATNVVFTLGLAANPQVVVGPVAPPQPKPLPDLRGTPGGGGFRVAVEGELPYDEATKLLDQKLKGTLVPLPMGKHKVVIERVRVYGSASAVVLQADVKGSVNGTIYFAGTPEYDVASRHIVVAGLDFTLETKNVLVKSADWLLHSAFRDFLTTHARWDVGGELDAARRAANDALNRPLDQNLSLRGRLELLPAAVILTNRSFKLLATAEGEVELNMQ